MNERDRIRSALSYIPATMARAEWARIGMAIKSELGDDGFDLFEDWSLSVDGISLSDIKSTWKSIKPSAGGKSVGLGTLIYEAKKGGWKQDSSYKAPTAAEIAERKAVRERKEAERALEEAQEHASAAQFAAELWAKGRPADDHPYLQRKGVKSHGLLVGPWYRLDESTGELVQVTNNGLYVPMKDRTGKLHSLQCISQKEDGGKRYLKGGAKRGHFHAVGTKPMTQGGNPVFCLGEGYATCASAHEATGHLVLTCFDAGNLITVARAIRERLPAAVIIMLADFDSDKPNNPGLTAATEAARDVGGLLAVPQLLDAPGAKCDFNDVHLADGLVAVAGFINGAEPPPPEGDGEPLEGLQETIGADEAPEPIDLPEEAPAADTEAAAYDPDVADGGTYEDEDSLANNGFFTVLGYDGEDYFFFNHRKGQVTAITASGLSTARMLELAEINWWEMYFPARTKGGARFDHNMATEWLFKVAYQRGIYDPDRVRGRGAWTDKGRALFHHGDYLTVDTVPVPLTKIESSYVYQKARSMPAPAEQPMTDEEGRHLLKVASMAQWKKPGSAALMAGWVMLAPICGALTWRSHIWLTGEAGSGKSTLATKFTAALLRNIAIGVQGDSSEAGIRQELKADALPVVIDEAESNNEGDKKRIENVIALIRKTSTESQFKTLKGTPTGDGNSFLVRSMFCLASITVNLPGKADIDRLTILRLKSPKKLAPGVVDERWVKLEEELNKISEDAGISSRLLARSLAMMPTILAALKVFRRVAAQRFGTQRVGDQLGTLMAGAWCLAHSIVPSEEQAMKMLNSYDWTEHADDGGGSDDPTKALAVVLEAKIRLHNVDYSVFEIIERASGMVTGPIALHVDDSDAALRRNGMKIEGDYVVFSNNSPALKELVAKTAYSTDLRGQLQRIEGASTMDNKTFSFSGIKSKGVGVPLSIIFDPPATPDPNEPPI